jgi:hypothetical protein
MTFDLEALLHALDGVEFVLVGGVAAAVQAPRLSRKTSISFTGSNSRILIA